MGRKRVFTNDERKMRHNERCNKRMKELYKINNGKEKSKLRYYKNLYKNEPEFTQLIDAFDNFEDKIREAKKYHLEQKMKTI